VAVGRVIAMTATLPIGPAPATAPARPSTVVRTVEEPDLTGFVLAHRALRSGTRQLAAAVDGIARDDACDPERRRAIAQFAFAVLTEVRAHIEREDAALWPLAVVTPDEWADLAPLHADHAELQGLLQRAWAALPVFARCASSGAPLLAPVLAELAAAVEDHLAEEEALVFPRVRAHATAAGLERTRVRLRAGTSTARLMFLLPWVADQCHPAELRFALAGVDGRTKLLRSLGQRRYAALRDAVLG
jgi:iron-sulfur cluster repair protein YtfE (RIC family)